MIYRNTDKRSRRFNQKGEIRFWKGEWAYLQYEKDVGPPVPQHYQFLEIYRDSLEWAGLHSKLSSFCQEVILNWHFGIKYLLGELNRELLELENFSTFEEGQRIINGDFEKDSYPKEESAIYLRFVLKNLDSLISSLERKRAKFAKNLGRAEGRN